MKMKNDRFENPNQIASQCIHSDSSRQAEFKYNHLDPRKSFLRHAHYHKQVEYKEANAVAYMFLVMDMTLSMP